MLYYRRSANQQRRHCINEGGWVGIYLHRPVEKRTDNYCVGEEDVRRATITKCKRRQCLRRRDAESRGAMPKRGTNANVGSAFVVSNYTYFEYMFCAIYRYGPEFEKYLQRYLFPCLAIFGILGNALNLTVLLNKRMRTRYF